MMATPEIPETPFLDGTPLLPSRKRRSFRFVASGGPRADFVFLVIGLVLVVLFVVLTLVPGLIAPYNPRAAVGPRLLSPGTTAPVFAVMVPDASKLTTLSQAPSDLRVGVLAGTIGIGDARTIFRTQVTPGVKIEPVLHDDPDDLAAAGRAGTEQALLVPVTGSSGLFSRLDSHGFRSVATLRGSSSGRSFLFGTDELGRDVLSRVIWATRTDLLIGLLAPAIAALIGLFIGVSSAYAGGRLDRTLAAIMDAVYSMPSTVLAIALAAAIGAGLVNLIAALSVVYTPTFFRLARSRALSVKQELFIDATRALGADRLRIIRRHVIPHSVLSVGVFYSVAVAEAIRAAATLSFLGLGLPPTTTVEWGGDIATGGVYAQQAWWLLAGPGLALTLLIFGLTLVSDALFERLNLRTRGVST